MNIKKDTIKNDNQTTEEPEKMSNKGKIMTKMIKLCLKML